ncbi:MAG: anhydro-N-acetylmuramic acid kinase [Bacteroidetes bacterium]|nr:anhydro-N-acetylmuramic acid kinase [Bacteroidota bacterium]MBU1678608.1 anhydro-N-acetylmuramic acid kinase [Bacteroidota bacterium]MBU2506820.1 anhydro-N-acetylmuramic acid kinase [Bacteroidota bacterium]
MLKKLQSISEKSKKLVIGLMSGTSVDGVDTALVEIENSGVNTKLSLIGFCESPFPNGLKEFILKNCSNESSRIEDISQLNFLLANVYAESVKNLLANLNFSADQIDLIGSHGQTIYHHPKKKNLFGFETASTLQIGDPSVLAKLTGITTVGDFRVGDVALGGQGAPLVPYFDYILFHSHDKNRALLNIGGISNFTILNKVKGVEEVLAFDTGPGNMMIDNLMQKFFDKPFDENGQIAESGKINDDLFTRLMEQDNFIETPPPKSTGREYYGSEFLVELLNEFKKVSSEDWLYTVTMFTAFGIYRNYKKFVEADTQIDELIVSGGGAKNRFLYNALHKYFGNGIEIKVIDEIGISSDAKEAICFAVLANETICGNPSNIPLTTGATRPTILGKICLP